MIKLIKNDISVFTPIYNFPKTFALYNLSLIKNYKMLSLQVFKHCCSYSRWWAAYYWLNARQKMPCRRKKKAFVKSVTVCKIVWDRSVDELGLCEDEGRMAKNENWFHWSLCQNAHQVPPWRNPASGQPARLHCL